jgi:hypothetical protein
MNAYVVCLNDTPKAVVIYYPAKAAEEMDELRKQHYAENKHSYKDFEDYKNCCHWHIMMVPVL